ncbi:MAG TPA: class I SAM-dependent methyltransferase [Acidisarcina sp.]|nr:class I SAM-dependent methyltransferase [Acidisarcina sp.]
MLNSEQRKYHWDNIYRTRAEHEVSWFEEVPAVSFELIRKSSKNLSGAIVDIGGGSSHLVDLLLRAGFSNINVLDVSASALQIAQARLGPQAAKVNWIESDVLQWNRARDIDIWHDRAAYHFLTEREHRTQYANVAARSIAPSGILIVQAFALEGPRSCSGLPVHRESAESIQANFADDFDLLDFFLHEHTTPSGTKQLFQVCRLRRR